MLHTLQAHLLFLVDEPKRWPRYRVCFITESVSLIVGEADFTGSFTDSDHAGT